MKQYFANSAIIGGGGGDAELKRASRLF